MLDYISTLQCYGALVLIQLKPGKVEFGTQESRLRPFSPNSRLFLETVQLIFITGSTSVTCIILDLCETPGAGLMILSWRAATAKSNGKQNNQPSII